MSANLRVRGGVDRGSVHADGGVEIEQSERGDAGPQWRSLQRNVYDTNNQHDGERLAEDREPAQITKESQE